jgi:hypothetical protein
MLLPGLRGSLAGKEAKFKLLFRTTGLIGLDPSDAECSSSEGSSDCTGGMGSFLGDAAGDITGASEY